MGQGSCEALIRSECYEIATALPGFHITLVAQQFVGMLCSDGADSGFLGEDPFGGEPCTGRIYLPADIFPELPVQL
jgi:hypothetical protein